MNRRRFLQALFAVPVVAAPLLTPAVFRSRCDADWIEAEWSAGRAVSGGNFVVRRPLRATAKWSTMRDSKLLFILSDDNMPAFEVVGYGFTLTSCSLERYG